MIALVVRGLAPTDRDRSLPIIFGKPLQDVLASIGVSPCLDFSNRKIDEVELGALNKVVMLNKNHSGLPET